MSSSLSVSQTWSNRSSVATDVTQRSPTNTAPPLSTKQPEKSEKSSKSSKSAMTSPPSKSFKTRNTKRLIWRDIYAEVKPQRPWWRLCCKKKEDEPKVVLDQISGVAEPGEVTFLMGSSGAGKTTLLNILTQRARGLRIYGEVQVNSTVLKAGEMRKISAYVPQEDIFVGALTVKETLMLAARLRMPAKATTKERKARVDQVILEMGLVSCLDTKIGCKHEKSISCGEKKRLSFACEILTDPPILFCDEPTSGLDSFMALQVMKALSTLAREGKTVVCSIHQPSSQVFEMADKLVLLVLGQIAYQGPIKEVDAFFRNCNMPVPKYISIPDHFMKVLSRNAHTESEEEYMTRTKRVFSNYKSCGYADAVHNETHRLETSSTRARMRLAGNNRNYAAPWHSQFFWLFWRGLKVVLREPMIVRVRLVQCVLVSIVLGILYFRLSITKDTVINARGLSFAVLRDMNMMFLMPCVHVFTEELHVVYREYQSAMYCTSAYYMGKQLADGLQYLLLPTIYCTFVYWMAGLEYSVVQFLLFWLVALLQAIVSTSVGYAGACIFGSLPMAAFFVPMLSVPMMIFAGFYIDPDSVPVYFQPLTYLSWYRYAFEANIINTFGRQEGVIPGCEKTLNSTFSEEFGACDGTTGAEMMEAWNIDPSLMWLNILALFLSIFAWRGIALFALWLRVRHH